MKLMRQEYSRVKVFTDIGNSMAEEKTFKKRKKERNVGRLVYCMRK